MAEQLTKLKHLPLLDGLRGLSLLVVIGFHIGPPYRLQGGWVTMDMFFMLSGFLITTLLVKEQDRHGRISLSTFYRRRIRRLGPSVLVLLAGVTTAVWLLGLSDEFPTTRDDSIATLFYFANWHYIVTQRDYFGSFSESLLEHTWSLAVEEQFYLLWPLLVIVLIRLLRGHRLVLGVLFTACLVPASYWIHHLAGSGVDLSRIHFGTDTRGPAFLIGGILALVLWPDRGDTPRGRAIASIAGGIAAVGYALVCIYLKLDTGLYRDYRFLIGYLSCAVLIYACARADRGPLVWIFGNRVSCHLGRISYVMYLWHWPVLLILAPPRVELSGPALVTVQLGVTLLLAELTHHFIEEPIHRRRWTFRNQGGVLAASTAGILVLILIAPTGSGMFGSLGDPNARANRPNADRVLVLGDSSAWVNSAAAPEDLPYRINAVYQARCDIVGDTLWIGSTTNTASADCDRWPERWARGIDENEPDVVLVMLGLRQLYDLDSNGKRLVVGSSEWEDEYRDAVARAVGVIRSQTDAPILWMELACVGWAQEDEAGEAEDPARVELVNRVLADELSGFPDITIVPYRAWVCPDDMIDESLRPDGGHLSVDAVAELWHRILRPRIDTLRDPDHAAGG